ncbi:PREDICTED: microfibrillar-associated protein 5 [Nanorana parkeri]|uniref:microfibrillar-associated protein 5 n=1 Tax=Nanorana parkeri TaxID=125878 RepID=UPI000854EC29|nr:PREDICTED: microfibrillar-associated protein 5 [Nanorana parkeri]
MRTRNPADRSSVKLRETPHTAPHLATPRLGDTSGSLTNNMQRMNGNCLCVLLLAVLAIVLPVRGNVANRRDVDDGDTATPTAGSDAAEDTVTTAGDCKEVQYPCTRVYSVQKPVKQCISYLCVTSVRRVYMVNKEICKRIMCKEDEVIQDEKCRQLAGLPPRRLPPPEEGTADGNDTR